MLGFGSTEVNLEAELESTITTYVREAFKTKQQKGFTNEFIEQIQEYVETLSSLSIEESKHYESAENFLGRYSYFWPYVLGDVNYIVVILKFHHVNRKHALSPDGWAAMFSKHTFSVSVQDMEK